MLSQRDFLRRMSGRAGVFLSGAVHDAAALPVRLKRTVCVLEDGSSVALAYDETLELQAVLTSGPMPIAVTISDPNDPQITFSLSSGTGDREVALPATTSAKLRATRVSQLGARWNGVRMQITPG